MAVVWGVRNVHYWQPSLVDLLIQPSMAITLAWWAIADSIARGRSIPLLSRNWFVIAAGVAVPGYVIWSRGWRGVGLLLLHAIGWYAVGVAAMIVGQIVTVVAI